MVAERNAVPVMPDDLRRRVQRLLTDDGAATERPS
jgi:hypothetical protein